MPQLREVDLDGARARADELVQLARAGRETLTASSCPSIVRCVMPSLVAIV